jgi:NADH-quinone oxidoreductase subunit H
MEVLFPVVQQALWTALWVFLAMIYGLLLAGIIRKIMGRIQGRIGPPIWQPIIDLFKLIFLRTSTYHGVMMYLAPVFRAVGGYGMIVFMPIVVGIPILENFSYSGDLLMIMYFFFFGQLGMALGAGEGGHPYSAIGISRGLSQMTAFEFPFALAMIALAAQTGSFSVSSIVDAQQGGVLDWYLFQNPLASIAAFIAMVAMNMYSPFDVVGAPQEIPVGPRTEYNATFLSLMMSGVAVFTVAKVILFVNLFLGGADGILEFVAKTFAVYFWSVFVGAVFPRYRVEQGIRFLLKWPALAGIAGVAFVMI